MFNSEALKRYFSMRKMGIKPANAWAWAIAVR